MKLDKFISNINGIWILAFALFIIIGGELGANNSASVENETASSVSISTTTVPTTTQPTTTTTVPKTTTTTSTTTTVPKTTTTTSTTTTTTTTVVKENFDQNTHYLVTLTGLPDNPYLCEIPGTGIYANWGSSTWGRCAAYLGSVPDYDNILIPAWSNRETYVTEDPIWCFYDGEIIGCNVLDRIKRNQSIQKTRDLIFKSLENLKNLNSGKVNSSNTIGLSSCKVYITNSKLDADYIVGIENAFTADYRIAVVGSSLGSSSCGKWYIQNSTIGTDFTIAYVDRTLSSDFVVDFVSSSLELP